MFKKLSLTFLQFEKRNTRQILRNSNKLSSTLQDAFFLYYPGRITYVNFTILLMWNFFFFK